MKPNLSATLGLVYVTLLAQTACQPDKAGAPEPKSPKLVFITAGTNSFWQAALGGIEAAAKDFKVEFELISTPPGTSDQPDADGIAYSPVNGAAQLVAARGAVCFLGVDQYKAGRKAGELIKQSLPLGGQVAIYTVHDLPERHQGLKDELADPQYTVIDVKSPAALIQQPNVACLVALSPQDVTPCVETLRASDRLSAVKLIGFEETNNALEALAAGHVHGLITHQPYQYGYHAVRVLAGLARGDASVLPKSGFLEIPSVVVRSETSSQAAAPAVH